MTDEKTTVSSGKIQLPFGLGTAFLIGAFLYGPIDLPRAVYNSLTGDTTVLKRQIGNYLVCKSIEQANPDVPAYTRNRLQKSLANELQIPVEGDKIDFTQAALDDLFDSAEERAGFYDDFVWLRLNNYKNKDCWPTK